MAQPLKRGGPFVTEHTGCTFYKQIHNNEMFRVRKISNPSAGMTLLELIVAIGILVILAGAILVARLIAGQALRVRCNPPDLRDRSSAVPKVISQEAHTSAEIH